MRKILFYFLSVHDNDYIGELRCICTFLKQRIKRIGMWREGVSPSYFRRGAGIFKQLLPFLGKTTREFANLETLYIVVSNRAVKSG
jgi:hypothetical protein